MNSEPKSLNQMFPKRIEIPLLIALSAILLCAGVSMPLMKIQQMVFWKNEYSVITGTIGLYKEKEYFLTALIFFFSLVFPFVKLIMLGILWRCRFTNEDRHRILGWLGQLGKWSMLDVFVVAVLIVAIKLGPMASVEPRAGIYVFSLAIMMSIATTVWVEKMIKH